MSCYQIYLLVLVIIGCYAQKPRSLAHKVNILERRMNSESNLRSHEIADIFQKLDEIDETVNKSLERCEKHCSIESKTENDDTKEVQDVAVLGLQDTKSNLGNDMLVKLRQAFGKEKVLLADIRNKFPNLRKQVERIQELTSDLQNENNNLNSISLSLKSETGNHSSEIQELGRVINDIQNDFEFLTDKVSQIKLELLSETIKIIEHEKEALTKAISYQEKEIQELKHADVEHQIKFEKIAEDIGNIRGDIDTYKTELTSMFDDLDPAARTFPSCVDAKNKKYTRSGIYSLKIDSTKTTLKVYCDQVTDGGGWMVFQRRIDGTEDFYRGWEEYKEGFGNLQAEFWLGNEYLSAITASGQHELRIDMEDFDGIKAFAQYKSFKIDDESQNYKLEVSGYHGNASDSLIKDHSGKEFSTKDRDNDISDKSNCAALYTGAWWYSKCYASNLNGKYFKLGRSPAGEGINWYYLKSNKYFSLNFVEMKLR